MHCLRSSAARSCRSRSPYEASGARRRYLRHIAEVIARATSYVQPLQGIEAFRQNRSCRMRLSATSRLSARRRTRLPACPRTSFRSIRSFRGGRCAICACANHTLSAQLRRDNVARTSSRPHRLRRPARGEMSGGYGIPPGLLAQTVGGLALCFKYSNMIYRAYDEAS